MERVLGWGAPSSTVPGDLVNGLSRGIGGTGRPFFSDRPYHVGFIIEFVDQWKELEDAERSRLLDDPWAFKDFVSRIDARRALFLEKPNAHQPQIHALLHLVFPDTFEGMVSIRHKQGIANAPAYASYIDHSTDDIDQKLAQIRSGLEQKLGRDFDFYDKDVRYKWDPEARNWDTYVRYAKEYIDRGTLAADEIDYKLGIAQKLGAARRAVLDNALGWSDLVKSGISGNIVVHFSQSKIRDWMDSSPENARQALAALWTLDDVDLTDRIRGFCTQFPTSAMSGPGTRMNVISQLLMGVDVETYPPFRISTFNDTYDRTGYTRPELKADEVALYAHALGFLDRFIEEANQRGVVLRHRLDAQSVMWQIQGDTSDDQFDEDDPDDAPEQGLAELAKKTYLTQKFLENIQTLLEDKKQVIFQGPPGTGKTFVAKKLAELLAGSKERVTLVQFHPSYAYEDFVRGFRPRLNDGDARYELWDGPLLRAAKKAQKDDDQNAKHFLVIDEINRGNIAKVFGELYFLLEYRDESITLQYQRVDGETLSLPENLYIIGTMNTADRSIALVDLALRRRFSFVEFHPDEEPVKGVLRRWLIDNSKSELLWLANVVELVNEKLRDDRHAAIGPSYFMPRNLNLDERTVERIWKHNVLPYIEERRFGDENVREEFDLSKLRGISETDGDPTDEDGDADAIGNGDGDGAD